MSTNEFQCRKCSASFNDEASLQRHIRMMHSDSQYTCDDCGMIFTTESELESHKQVMHSEVQSNQDW